MALARCRKVAQVNGIVGQLHTDDGGAAIALGLSQSSGLGDAMNARGPAQGVALCQRLIDPRLAGHHQAGADGVASAQQGCPG